jgi:tRNA pseudouridine13 synthase
VSAEEAAAGTWRIEDVVLPLPGRDVRYPDHATTSVYAELATLDGVSLDSSPHGTKEFSVEELPGAYRRVLHSLQDLEVGDAVNFIAVLHPRAFAPGALRLVGNRTWLSSFTAQSAALQYEILRYSHPDTDLALTDLMELEGRQLPPPVAPNDEAGGQRLALRLTFTLPSSCYATMLIRELTKQPTSTSYHAGRSAENAR